MTFLTTLVAGMLWQNETDLIFIGKGLPYSLSLLFILSCHEFGHYFAARRHGVPVTLPYFIPLPPVSIIGFGTLGAVIRTRKRVESSKALFDIGVAGPIAGFIASMLVLAVGFMTLPGPEFILGIHPDFDFTIESVPGLPPGSVLTFGKPILYGVFADLFARPGAWIPPMWEMYHYPFLITGWFGLFVTAMNLLPVGQLDGGHILFALSPKLHRLVARVVFMSLLWFGGMGMLPDFLRLIGLESYAVLLVDNFSNYYAVFWSGWMIWAVFLAFVVKLDHPEVVDYQELDPSRRILGWFSLAIFAFSIIPAPIFFQ
ncbi:MAG: site-2 protease family protein [Bacteroidota bacterium]|nr:site-2 protease family protein [Bacteroidota bacterium]